MEKIIYAVSSGCYSDYRIDAIFDNKELAQKFIDTFDSREFNEIEEYDINPNEYELKNNYSVYFVRMDRNGNSIEIEKRDSTYDCFNDNCGYCVKGNMYTTVWAKDEKHAIKITNERRINEIHLGRFKT
jgi:hypothetical protein